MIINDIRFVYGRHGIILHVPISFGVIIIMLFTRNLYYYNFHYDYY